MTTIKKIDFLKFKIEYKYNKKLINKNFIKSQLSLEEGNKNIYTLLSNENPCMIGRIGSSEMQALNECYGVQLGFKKTINENVSNILYTNAGFFPNKQNEIMKFCDLYTQCANDLDLFAILGSGDEGYFVKTYAKNKPVIPLQSLESYYFNEPWTKALKDKKILVISPFSNSIKVQYENNRVNIWKNENILPKFNLTTFQSYQTIGDNTEGFENWFDALNAMENKIKDIEFDISIIGCGAYSFPLASFIKTLGKKSIVLGGATQILFGIKGKRWDNNAKINRFYNDYWVRPMSNEIPKDANKVENGCYW